MLLLMVRYILPLEKTLGRVNIPKLHYVFFESNCFHVPKIQRDEIDYCVWNESDRKRV